MRRGVSLFILGLVAAGPVGLACRTTPPGDAGQADAAGAKAVAATQAAFERDPIGAQSLAAWGRALAQAGRQGEAAATLATARFLCEHPPATRARPDAKLADALASEAASALHAGVEVEEAPKPALPAAERHAREDALKAYSRHDVTLALARASDVPPADRDRNLMRVQAACATLLALKAARSGEDARAIDHLWAAANADPSARTETLFRDVARLERSRALAPAAVSRTALLRALRAAPDEPETLWLLARSTGAESTTATAEVAAWARATLLAIAPKSPEARFFAAADQVRAAPSIAEATRAAEAFERENRGHSGLAADLWSLVAEHATGDAARDARAAATRFGEARDAAMHSRDELEGAMTPATATAIPAHEGN